MSVSEGPFEEKRRRQRLGYVGGIVFGNKSFRVRGEVLDISELGVGLSWMDGELNPEGPSTLEVELEGTPGVFECTIAGSPARPQTDLPNNRIFALQLVQTDAGPVKDVLRGISTGLRPPRGASRGFCRAWNALNSSDQGSLSAYLDNLAWSNPQLRLIRHNLIRDPNTFGHQVKSLLFAIVHELRSNGDRDPMTVLKRAQEGFLSNVEYGRCRQVNVGQEMGLSRYLRLSTVKRWLFNLPPARDSEEVLADIVKGETASKPRIIEALRLVGEPTIGRPGGSFAWAVPEPDVDRLREDGFEFSEVIEAIAPNLVAREDKVVVEISYPVAVAGQAFKPCAALAGNHPHYRSTPESEVFGRTIGSTSCPGLPELVHPQRTVSGILRRGGRIRSRSLCHES